VPVFFVVVPGTHLGRAGYFPKSCHGRYLRNRMLDILLFFSMLAFYGIVLDFYLRHARYFYPIMPCIYISECRVFYVIVPGIYLRRVGYFYQFMPDFKPQSARYLYIIVPDC
jgi:hypothetical protein